MKHNATVIRTWEDCEGSGTFVASVEKLNGRLQILRANAVQCTGYEDKLLTKDIPSLNAKAGDAAYDVYLHSIYPDSNFQIILDNGKGYKNRLRGLSLPPSYQM